MSPEDRAVSLIYQAAVDRELWPAALRALADEADCPELALNLFGKQVVDGTSVFQTIFLASSGGIYGWEAVKLYTDYYSRLDAMASAAAQLDTGGLLLSHELISEKQVARSEYFQDFLIPQGGRYMAGWTLEHSAERMVALAFHSPRAPFEREAIEKFAVVAEHVRVAFSLTERVAGDLQRGDSFRQVLNQTGVACIVVDANARVLDCSVAAADSLETGSPLRVILSRLHALRDGDTDALRSLISRSANSGTGGFIRVGAGQGKSVILEVASAAVERGQLPGWPRSACAFVFLPPMRRAPDADRIQALLGCTHAEAQVAELMVAGQLPHEITENRRVSMNTLRTQVRNLMAKAEVHRAADLVLLLTRNA